MNGFTLKLGTNRIPVRSATILSLLRWSAIAWIVVFWRLGYTGLLDPDEAHYAELTREMLRAHSWFVPLLDGAPFIDKPVLFHWLQVVSIKVLGSPTRQSHAQCAGRLALIGVTLWVATELFDRKVGQLAALMFATFRRRLRWRASASSTWCSRCFFSAASRACWFPRCVERSVCSTSGTS